MFRGHIRVTPAHPASEQEAILIAAGVPKRAIYVDDIASAIRSLRKGNRLVVDGFRALGSDREEITAAVEAVHLRSCLVMDAATKRVSGRPHQEALVKEAVIDLANERRGPRKKRTDQLPWDQIQVHWLNPLLSNKACMAKINAGRKRKISNTTVWRKLGKRPVVTGRPSNARRAGSEAH